MSVFGNIMSAIFRHGAAQAQSKPTGGTGAAGPSTSGGNPPHTGSAAAPESQVDVAAVLLIDLYS
jgi:hypothetical protein